jgi:uncharacterized membrane protein
MLVPQCCPPVRPTRRELIAEDAPARACKKQRRAVVKTSFPAIPAMPVEHWKIAASVAAIGGTRGRRNGGTKRAAASRRRTGSINLAKTPIDKAKSERPMNDLLVIAFPTEQKAEEVRQKLFELQKEYLIELGDAVVAVKHEDGKIKLNQMINTTAAGAVSGTFWGLLVGTLFALPLVGAAIGAASGALGGSLADFGINDDFMREVAEAVPPGGAALFLLVKKITTDKVLADLRGVGGTVLRTSFDKSQEDAIKDALAGRPSAAATEAPSDDNKEPPTGVAPVTA